MLAKKCLQHITLFQMDRSNKKHGLVEGTKQLTQNIAYITAWYFQKGKHQNTYLWIRTGQEHMMTQVKKIKWG
uniref:Uncharacterized protein n=1 Tax=Arion vulgaris TaxID=1028688 RepID=A0A0B7BKV5_9EUPU